MRPSDPAGTGPGFAVYVHWPFCLSKCPYCDFNSHVRPGGIDEDRFLAAYLAEIDRAAGLAPGRAVRSIFFGGGTPSLMRPATVGAILERIAARWRLEDGVEITLEANPTSVEAGRFAECRAAGVNRLSLGVQALNAEDLAMLGRRHSVGEALSALKTARDVFPRVSADLIYARPGRSASDWQAELEQALAFGLDHMSLYQLTIEMGTPFFAAHRDGKLVLPDADAAAALYEQTADVTARHGLPAYEISNHARPGNESRHNLVYWRYGEYVGIGAGAHGRLMLADGRHATANLKKPEHWLEEVERAGRGLSSDEILSAEEAGDEFLLMGLRLVEGIELARYEALSGRVLDPDRLADLVAHGMVVEHAPGRVRVTPAGWTVLDAVVADLAA
ncbi:MAG: radical SAM family heme chaperone HemW [Hyphomicrobiales bacterium]